MTQLFDGDAHLYQPIGEKFEQLVKSPESLAIERVADAGRIADFLHNTAPNNRLFFISTWLNPNTG